MMEYRNPYYIEVPEGALLAEQVKDQVEKQMKKPHFLYLLVWLPQFVFSQQSAGVPPGTIRISDSLYIDQTPVTNLMYREFLESLETFWSPEMHQRIKYLPKYGLHENFREWNSRESDSTFVALLPDADDQKSYMHHPDFRNNPVVQVSRREAEFFCRWRTDMVMLLWATKAKTPEERERFPEEIKYRLPSCEELDLARAYFSEREELEITEEESPLDLRVEQGLPQKFVLRNISEYTRDNRLYGTNWKDVVPVIFPNEVTGFRCICEIKAPEGGEANGG